MLPDFFVGSNMDAVNFVVGDVALHPLNLGTEIAQHAARLLRDALQLTGDNLPAFGISRSMTYFGITNLLMQFQEQDEN